jgi:hypothetical protein
VSMFRGLAVPIGVVAAVLLVLLFNPWYVIEGDIRTVLTVAFWVTWGPGRRRWHGSTPRSGSPASPSRPAA